MSDSDSDHFSFNDDSDSDDYEVPKPKKQAIKAIPKAAPKPKAAAKPKVAPKAPAPKKKALEERDQNSRSDSDADPRGMDVNDEEDDDVPAMAGPSAGAKKGGKAKTASETYVKLSQLDHVLKRPDTYIGSVEPITQAMWVFDEPTKSMVHRPVTFVPGLYKIVDEILVNAADNKIRDDSMKNLKVEINVEKKTISVWNDGAGIPIEMHSTENIWIPELIFGHLLTSSNYDDDEAKVTGGRNGYGAKLANIYSTEFIVETADSKSGKIYKQVFMNNMSTKGKPKITTNPKGQNWTRITFTPDLARFHMTEFDADTVALLRKRVYDMAGITKGVNVSLDGSRVQIKGGGFKGYVEMYTTALAKATTEKLAGDGAGLDLSAGIEKPTIIYEKFNDRWEVAFAVSDGSFQQVSFCNSIATTKGGTHVKYIADQICDALGDIVQKKNKSKVPPNQIRNQLWVFVNCLINNPAFDSQTKENMTLGKGKFGSTCKIGDDFMKKITKSGVVESILSFAKFKQEQQFKKTDGNKRSRITGLAKLEDANNAGTKNGHKCTLILTEGDSAKSLAVSGINVVGRDNYGVFPLRGKLLNVREATGKTLLENAEIKAIKQIMGLQSGKTYTNTDSLRYGSLMIMADQDHDGSHIKGLVINFFDYYFPSLLKLPDFLIEFITPIVKATKKTTKKEVSFFTIPEYEVWKEENNDGQGYHIKYFKGLGTSTAQDAKKYFGDLRQHRLPFKPVDEEERELIDMAFNKKKADNRKEWLRGFVPGTFMDHNVQQVKISDFINKELILFSMADNVRSIPSLVDGFKPGQRKVLFGCFKRNLKQELKVAQLAGYVSEHSAYHHGEASLNGTIVGLAQSFVGSNNLNLLQPNGQFGTRLQGGKDAASPRYIFTQPCKVTRTIFHKADDNVLDYLNDDGQSIEPSWYIPVIPMVLVNGSDGIGTGWSSTIPNYNPTDIVANLKRKMAGEELEPMHPWYRGFRGTIEKVESDSYKCSGVITRIDDSTLEVTELPIRSWTQTYKEMLEGYVAGSEKTPALVKDYKEYHTDTTVHFIVTLTEKGKETIAKEGLDKSFKISTRLNTSNMVVFDAAGKIKKFSTPEEILEDFYDIRLEYYHKRKAHLLSELTHEHDRLSNQARFIQMIITKQLVISNRKRSIVVAELRAKDFKPFPKKRKAQVAANPDDDGEDEEDEGADSDYDYLLSMSLYSLTAEKVAKLLAERDEKEEELNTLMKLSATDLWNIDLDVFSTQWAEMLEEDVSAKNRSLKNARNKGKGKAGAVKKARLSDDSEDDFNPQLKKPAVKAKPKPKVDLPESDEPMEDAEVPAPPKPVAKSSAKPVPKPAAKVAPKKRASSDLDDAPGPSKPKALKKTKAIESEDEEDIWAMPSRPPKSASKKPATKKPVSSDDDSELEVYEVKKKAAPKAPINATKAPVTTAVKKPSQVVETDSDAEMIASAAPKPTRRAATKKTYALDISDDEEEESDDAESSFNDDSD